MISVMHCLHLIYYTNITIACLLTINYERLKVTGKVIMAWAPAGGDKNRRSPSPLEITTVSRNSAPKLKYAKLTEHASTPTKGSASAAGFDIYR